MFRRLASLMTQPCRSFKSDLKLKWIRPPDVECYDTRRSGDLEAAVVPPRTDLALPFARSSLLRDQPDAVQNIFTVGYIGDKASLDIYRRSLVERVMLHKYDDKSMEVKIAKLTGTIRGLQVHLEKSPRDGRSKTLCKELIEKRKKFLKYLRRWDYKRFEWVLEKLQVEYKPAPPDLHPVTRKISMKKLKNIYCNEVRAEKMKQYKLELIEQRDVLLKEYAENPLPPLKTIPEETANDVEQSK